MILLVAIGLVEHHRERWRGRSNSSGEDQASEQVYYRSQFRRRVAASSLIALVGALLIADSFVANLFAANLFARLLIIFAVLLLLAVIFMLAVWDMLSIHRHFHTDRAGANRARLALMNEAERILAEKHRRDQQQSTDQEQQNESR